VTVEPEGDTLKQNTAVKAMDRLRSIAGNLALLRAVDWLRLLPASVGFDRSVTAFAVDKCFGCMDSKVASA
jgi:hypothetical protein